MAAAQMQVTLQNMPGYLQTFRDQHLSNLRPVQEFFDTQHVSRPNDLNEATARISHNTRHFAGNYFIVVAGLAVYALLTNPLLVVALFFLIGGFVAINRLAPEPTQVGEHVITQKGLYTGLFVLGIPLLWFAAPLSTIFWIIGSSAVLILGHASLLEPGVESEYQQGAISQV